MTYDRFEQSAYDSVPTSLYLFTYGPLSQHVFAYTDGPIPVEHGGIKYSPEAVGRGDLVLRGEFQSTPLELRIAPSSGLANYFREQQFEQDVRLVIRSFHESDPDRDTVVVWTGRVVSTGRVDTHVELSCESVISGFDGGGAGRRYQRACHWPLYGAGSPACNAIRRVRAEVGVLRIGTNAVVIPAGSLGGIDREKYIGGYASWNSVGITYNRTIVRISQDPDTGGDTLLFQGLVHGVSLSTRLRLFAGCNHLEEDCRDLHDNIVNFGGQPGIPLKNPISRVHRFD
ncbi:MAG: phage BR0599 family protein [Rhodospirillales bacterium]|nr:phage BR0599 family protein [Rhodospirillales bacterium]